MAKKKKVEIPEGYYSLNECVEVSGMERHEITRLTHDKGIKYQVKNGYIFVNKVQFDNYLKIL